jgi:hypothetical protein
MPVVFPSCARHPGVQDASRYEFVVAGFRVGCTALFQQWLVAFANTQSAEDDEESAMALARIESRIAATAWACGEVRAAAHQ